MELTKSSCRAFAAAALIVCSAFILGGCGSSEPPDEPKSKATVIKDPSGDAMPSWDITQMAVTNGYRKLAVEVQYRGKLRPYWYTGLGFMTAVELDFQTPNTSYDSDFTINNVIGAPGYGNGTKLHDITSATVDCPGLRSTVDVDAGTVLLVVPQRCFAGWVGRVRTKGYTYAIRGSGRTTDQMDGWGPWVKLG